MRAFLSFTMEDLAAAREFKTRVGSSPGLTLVDYPVLDEFEPNWKERVRELIQQADVLICLVGQHTHLSQPVAWELAEAFTCRRVVVAVLLDSGLQLPHPLRERDVQVLRWDDDVSSSLAAEVA